MLDDNKDSGDPGADPTAPQVSVSPALRQGEVKDQKEGLVHITEGYYKYTNILFDWPKYMNIWHRNAVKALLNGESMTHPDHPFAAPDGGGVELYLGTAEDGQQKLLFSLKQIEYLQYYIHETGLALPRTVYEMTGGKDGGWPEDFDFESVKIQERIPLPLNVLLPTDVGEVKPIKLASLAAIKKEVSRISKHNKVVKKNAIMMRPSTSSEQNLAEAWADNERDGPGLRSGPRRKVYNQSGWDNEDGDLQTPGSGRWEEAEAKEALVAPSPGFSDSNSNGLSLSNPPSILEKPEPDTPTEHHHHAQQALLLASQGGLVAALHHSGEPAPEGESGAEQKKIGRSLFLALDVVTSEADESVVLEIGWAAIWWQCTKADDPTSDFEPTRDQGHFIVQDHPLTTKNGKVKPDHRDKYLFGSSLPVQEKDVGQPITQLLADLSKRAGEGPVYIVLHTLRETFAKMDATIDQPTKYIDLLKIGLFPSEWSETLRPTLTPYPIYGTFDGVGQTSIINTSLLYEAVTSQSNVKAESGPSSNSSESLGDVAAWLFSEEEERLPKFLGNAGNNAHCLIEVFMSLMIEHELPQPGVGPTEPNEQSDLPTNGSASSQQVQEASAQTPNFPSPNIPDGFVEVKELNPDETYDHDSASDSEDGGIRGVYFRDANGDLVEYDDGDSDDDD